MKSTDLAILTLTSVLITHAFFKKNNLLQSKSILSNIKNTMNSVQHLILNNQ